MSAKRPGLLVAMAPLVWLFAQDASAGSCIGGQDCPKLTGSPVGSGYWAWPRKKLSTDSDIAAACRSPAFVASDGSYITVDLTPRAPQRLLEQGLCKFDSDAQTERCDQIFRGKDGYEHGVLIMSYVTDDDGALKATVKGEAVDGPRKGERVEFDIYPVRCPDTVVLEAMRSFFSAR
jgi:hypothetical protein